MGENPAGQRGKYALVLAGVGHADSGVDLKLPSYGGSLTSVPEDFQRASGKPFGAPAGAYPFPAGGNDAPTTAREQGLQPCGAFTLFFRWRKKSVQKKASGTATPEAARPAARYSQISAFRALPCPALVFAQACQSLTAYGSCAHWARAPSRPKLRSAGALRAVLDLGSLRSPAGKKASIAHFDGGARNVARNGVG